MVGMACQGTAALNSVAGRPDMAEVSVRRDVLPPTWELACSLDWAAASSARVASSWDWA